MNQFDPHNFLRDLNRRVLIEEAPELGMFFENAMKTAIKAIKKEIRETKKETRRSKVTKNFELLNKRFLSGNHFAKWRE